MFFLGIDPLYWIMMLPCLILAGFASFMVKSTFAKYSRIRAYSGWTGAQAARRMLQQSGVFDVQIEKVGGSLTDHYDPSAKVLRLSPNVYSGNSLTSVGVACHEAGHAIQHATGYAALGLRTALVPITNISGNIGIWILLVGFLFQSQPFLLIGCVLFAVSVVFSLVTLPVEWDASSRAKRHILAAGVVSPDQSSGADSVLNAAFMTYVAAAVSSIVTLLYYLLRSGLLGGRNDN